MKSIMQEEKQCFLCGRMGDLDRHHCIHGTANRKLAEADGLWVWLCPNCHTMSPDAVHRNGNKDRSLKQEAQRAFEKRIGSRKEFMFRYGKSYL